MLYFILTKVTLNKSVNFILPYPAKGNENIAVAKSQKCLFSRVTNKTRCASSLQFSYSGTTFVVDIFKISFKFCEISSSHGCEYEVQNCLLYIPEDNSELHLSNFHLLEKLTVWFY
jgi:hypothetical protein